MAKEETTTPALPAQNVGTIGDFHATTTDTKRNAADLQNIVFMRACSVLQVGALFKIMLDEDGVF